MGFKIELDIWFYRHFWVKHLGKSQNYVFLIILFNDKVNINLTWIINVFVNYVLYLLYNNEGMSPLSLILNTNIMRLTTNYEFFENNILPIIAIGCIVFLVSTLVYAIITGQVDVNRLS